VTAARIALVTIVHGRHDHLSRLLWGLGRQTRPPDVLVVVAIDDDDVESAVREAAPAGRPAGRVPVLVPSIGRAGGRLPLAAARNLGALTSAGAGATGVVVLDVDCIPSPRLVERYAAVMEHGDGRRPVVWA
jgi:hypothetical protein